MQLRGTRLCLDCEELHRDDRCPVCASEAFAYLTRWVPVDERRSARRRQVRQEAPPQTGSGLSKWLARGAAGVTLLAAGRWLWNSTRPMEWSEPSAPRRRTWPPPDTDGGDDR